MINYIVFLIYLIIIKYFNRQPLKRIILTTSIPLIYIICFNIYTKLITNEALVSIFAIEN
jgi:hypothetical protein